MAQFLLPCIEGIEPEVAADALNLGARSATPARGRVLVEADDGFLYTANLAHPTASRVLLVLTQGRVATLKDVEGLLAEIAWDDLFSIDRSFAGDCVRIGDHPFTSVDVAKAVGDAVCDRFRAATNGAARPAVRLNDPDVDVVVHVRNETAYVCVDVTGAPLQHRPWRVYKPQAPLPATLASALVRTSGWTHGLLLDPMCGSGTIPIEADHRARHRAVNLSRATWAFQKLRIHDERAYDEARDALACRVQDDGPPILANEQWEATIAGARQNAQAAGATTITFSHDDFNRLPRPDGLTRLVANPPWGLRMASRRTSDQIGAQLRAKMEEWAQGGLYEGVVIVGNRRFEKEPPAPSGARDVEVGGAYARILTYRLG